MKRKIFTLLILMSFLFSVKAQDYLPVADLLDIKFSSESGEVKDISEKKFRIKNGGIIPTVMYDNNIKQYISRFPQNTTNKNYFRVDYMSDSDFKNKIQKSFTLEVYIKAESNKEMSPVGSMEYGGFGIQQIAKGATQLFFGKNTDGYHQIGSKNIYGNIKSDYHHIVYTYDGTLIRSYYDGSLTDNLPNAGKLRLSPTNSAQWIAIGGDVSGSNSMQREFIGDIALVRMYSTALSSSEIESIYGQLQERKKLSSVDQLNTLLTKTLKQYPNQNIALPYLEKGWNLMNSLSTTEEDISNFLLKIGNELAVSIPEVYKYPRFAVISDIHVGRGGWEKRLSYAVEAFKNQEPKLDALFIVGDIADNGRKDQLKSAVNTFSPLLPETQVYYIMGNHDWEEGNNKDIFKSVIGQRTNQFIEIKGYPFITVSVDGSASDNQRYIYQSTSQNFLRSALEKASQEYPGKPIFVYMHVPLHNTVYGSYAIAPGTLTRSANTEAMKNICNSYPQAIIFSGHSHHPLGDERCIHQEKFTAIHDGNLTFTAVEDGLLPDGQYQFSKDLNITEGCIVTVDKKNDVTVQRMDFTRNEQIKKLWTIKAPHDGSMFTYTSTRNGGQVPFFSPADKLAIGNIQGNSFKITFPQAQDDEGVHHYLVELLDKNGVRERKVNIFSEFFFGSAMPAFLSWTFKDLKGIYSDYQVKVTAIDSFYPNNVEHSTNKSEPLVGSVKDIEYQNLYLVGSAVPCGWSNSNPEVMSRQGDNGEFIWTGWLKKGEFKFLLKKNAWDPSVNPSSTQNIQSGQLYNTNITNGSTGDYKFNVTKDMYCSVIINTKNWTVKVEENKENTALYLIGDATPNGWYNDRATPMTKESEGIFTWSGELKAGHFKFITQLGIWNSIVPTGKAHENIIIGNTHRISDNYQGDYRFILGSAGSYTIKVNLNNYTMVVSKESSTDSNLYIIGDAAPNGWYNDKATPMIKEAEGIFTWSGYLKKGHFKFITQLGTWNSIVPTVKSHEDIIPEFKHYISDNYQGDYRFNLLDAGYYTIKVNLNEGTMYVDKDNSNASIYIIGDAAPIGWYNNKAEPLIKIGDRIYQWSGRLKAGHFKFITRLGTWNSLVPVPAKNETIQIGEVHGITNNYRGDYRFVISREDNYIVTVDLDNRTLSVNYVPRTLGNNEIENKQPQFTIITENNTIAISTNVWLDVISLFSINGKLIDMKTDQTGTFYIGSYLEDGVYLIEMAYQGERVIRKIIIQ